MSTLGYRVLGEIRSYNDPIDMKSGTPHCKPSFLPPFFPPTMSIAEKREPCPPDRIESANVGSVRNAWLGYEAQLQPNRQMSTILFLSLSITAVPYGFGSSLLNAVYGGGPLAMFVGLLIVLVLDSCVALSLSELASRYPASSGVYYWSYRLMKLKRSKRRFLSFTTGWLWLIGHWTITLSVNFGFVSMLMATVAVYKPTWEPSTWQILLIFWLACLLTFAICSTCNSLLPLVDTVAATFVLITTLAIAIAVSATAKAGRHSVSYALGHFDPSLSGWGNFGFFIGLLPPAYTFSALGMATSMAEECTDPEIRLAQAISLVPVIGGLISLFFVLPICFTLPPVGDIIAETMYNQPLPIILLAITGTKAETIFLMVLVLFVTLFCAVSITTTASRCTWAFSRDNALPFSAWWSQTAFGQPLAALGLVTVVEMLLGIIYIGSSSAFTAFASVGVIALAASYGVPLAISIFTGRQEVNNARWKMPHHLGLAVNSVALLWILFQIVLFCMPVSIPVTPTSMSYAVVVLVGLIVLSVLWFFCYARKSMYHHSFFLHLYVPNNQF